MACSPYIWRGLLIGAFALFLFTVLGLTGDGTVGTADHPTSPPTFALLAVGFMAFAAAD